MVSKQIKYVDFNNNEVTETIYFNLTKAEIAEMELKTDGGYAAKLNKVVETKDPVAIIDTFKELLLDSYGVKSEDGRRFIKSPQLREEFSQSEAYSEVFYSLISDETAMMEFVTGIFPANLNK